ncbi:MAG: hypothetical protein PVI57_00565 [Gemmatimonadota bacterium]
MARPDTSPAPHEIEASPADADVVYQMDVFIHVTPDERWTTPARP